MERICAKTMGLDPVVTTVGTVIVTYMKWETTAAGHALTLKISLLLTGVLRSDAFQLMEWTFRELEE